MVKRRIKVAAKVAAHIYTHVFQHLHDGEDEQDVFLPALQLLVLELAVHLAVPQDELFGETLEVGGDISAGFSLPPEPKLSAGSVYLSEQLQRRSGKQTVDNAPQHTETHQTKSVHLDALLLFA